MKSRAFAGRRLLGGAALSAVLVLAAGAPGAAGTFAAVGGAGETVLPAGVRAVPRFAGLEGYGDTGLLSQPEGIDHQQWTDYATGRTRDLSAFAHWDGMRGTLGLAQSDTAYEVSLSGSPYVYRFRDVTTGADRGSVTVPTGLQPAGTAGTTVVAYESRGTSTDEGAVHLLRPTADGGTADTVVTGFPQGASILAATERDARSLLLRYRITTDDPHVFRYQLALVDVRDGSLTKVFEPYRTGDGWVPVLTHDYVGLWLPSMGARLVRRDDPQGPVVEIPATVTAHKMGLTVLGDRLVAVDDKTYALLTMPLTGDGWQQLLPRTDGPLKQAPDGSVVVAAGSGPQDWGVQRVTESSDGQVAAREVLGLPPLPARVGALTLAGGTLTYTDQSAASPYDVMWNSRTVSRSSPPQAGPLRQAGAQGDPCPAVSDCSPPFGLSDGTVVYAGSGGSLRHRTPSGQEDGALFAPDSRVTSADGMDTTIADGGEQVVFDWSSRRRIVASRKAATGALWAGQFWTTTSTAGHLTMTRLDSSDPAVDVNVGSPCVPSELQVHGRWIYWACAAEARAGVFDRARGRSVAVPAGDALLADGFLIRHDTARGKLVRTDVTSEKAVSADVADLPAAPETAGQTAGSDRRVRWTLDAATGQLAYVDPAERVHLLTAGPLAAPVRRDHVGQDGLADLLTLDSSGRLTFQQGDGRGGFAGKASGAGWSAKAVAVPFGDLNGDRCNDVLVRMPDGSLRGYRPACGQAPTPSTPYTRLGTGWNAYDVLTSPGDLTGDGRADLLARRASTGDVYLFAARSDGTLAAGRRIASAWKGYPKIVGAGDLTGDGTGDVLARDKAGTLWRYDGTGTGSLKGRVRVFSHWGGSYDAVVGVGDLTGDGASDLVARDGTGTLYRLAGNGRGSFGTPVRISGGWKVYAGLF
ncbi:VCBS repeat-containing protein [Streptomyces sp. NPDC052109]|uniref:FG-GAP repeat domain-containing protein n=1 Tax=Streptomyces sp. NPDC052109 TaxID=3155527 RepID=UPI00342FCFE9